MRYLARSSRTAFVVAAFSAWASADAQVPPDAVSRPTIAIEGVSVVDVERGMTTAPRTVLVVDGRIASVLNPAQATIPPQALRVDGRGRFLMPGLVDMHVHLFNNATRRPPNDWTFPLFVANGVLAVRDMSTLTTALPIVAGWNATIARGELVAPRVLAAGPAIRDGDEAQVRRQVRDAHAAGAGFVKIFSELPEAAWRQALDEARSLQLPVYGHVPASVTLRAAADAGQRSAEHLMQIYEACSAREASYINARQASAGQTAVALRDAQEPDVLASFDSRRCERSAIALTRTGMVQVPTLVLTHFEAKGDRTRFADDPRWRWLRPDEQQRWQRILSAQSSEDAALAGSRLDVALKVIATLHRAGVAILAGTDAPMPLVYPGAALHEELALLVGAGLTPAEALRAATSRPAELLGLSNDHGSVVAGKRADLVLLDADPLLQIENARRIHAVILDGRLLRRADLDALLDAAAPSVIEQARLLPGDRE